MNGLMYSAQFNGVAVTAQQDFFEITAGSASALVIHQIIISQSTEVGDAQDEGLRILIKRGQTTSGSGGSSPTPVPLLSRYPSANAAVEANNTTKASAGTIVTLHAETWYIRNGFIYLPTPELRIGLAPSQRLTVELNTTPADSITIDGVVYFEEIG